MTPARTKVLSIVGPGRSGTTILASILGEVEGAVNTGELRWLWARGVVEQRSCGCGRPPADCPVWSQVLTRVLGTAAVAGPDRLPPAAVLDILSAQRELTLVRHRLRVIRGASGGDDSWPALERMREVTAQLLRSIGDVTGAQVLIDTSKRAQDAAVLATLDQIDHYVLHIVRDPRAVAWSWRRIKANPALGGSAAMSTRALVPSVARWNENCLGAELLRHRVPTGRWMSLRYEDFAAQPRATVDRILSFLGHEVESPFIDADSVVLRTNHTVAGNPNRFRIGEVSVRSDDEWRRGMPRRDQLCIKALTLPLLLRYGYPLRPATRRSIRTT